VPVEEFAARWARNVSTALELGAERPRSFRIVRYERFTGDPEATFAEVCAFLGEPYDRAALEPWEDRPQWPLNPRLMEEILPSSESWTDDVPPDDAAAVENHVREQVERLGYERYTVAEQA